MTEPTLVGEITTLIRDELNQIPKPEPCTVIKSYTEPDRADVQTANGNIKYVKCLFSNTLGHKGILIYLNGNANQPIAIIENREV